MNRPSFSFSKYQLGLFLDFLQIFTIMEPEEVPPENLLTFPFLPKYHIKKVKTISKPKISVVFERPVEIDGQINDRFRFLPQGGIVIKIITIIQKTNEQA
jgi:hypothetical protein